MGRNGGRGARGNHGDYVLERACLRNGGKQFNTGDNINNKPTRES